MVSNELAKILFVGQQNWAASLACSKHGPEAVIVVCDERNEAFDLALDGDYSLVIIVDHKENTHLHALALCKRLVAANLPAPIVVLSDSFDPAHELAAFRTGVDAFIDGSIPLELIGLKLRALLRRGQRISSETKSHFGQIQNGNLEIDLRSRSVTVSGRDIELTKMEFDLLIRLVSSPNQVCSKEELLREVIGHSAGSHRNLVNTHISRIRSKIGLSSATTGYIKTVWGMGYRYVPPVGECC